tara:strand:+ start:654 stop:950 length:297 start_codon:yes stop_codon:yes gene_type:complete
MTVATPTEPKKEIERLEKANEALLNRIEALEDQLSDARVDLEALRDERDALRKCNWPTLDLKSAADDYYKAVKDGTDNSYTMRALECRLERAMDQVHV